MPGSSSTSFIPKRNPDRKDRQSVKRKVFFGSFVIRIIFFSVLMAAVGVYFYKDKLNTERMDEVATFNAAIGKFDVSKMEEVLSMDLRLAQANDRLANSASITSLLKSFEESTIGSSQLIKFSLARTNDTSFEIEAEIKTDKFDSVLFQRSSYEKSSALAVTKIDDLVLQNVPPTDAIFAETTGSEEGVVAVSFTAILSVNQDSIRHLPKPISQDFAPIVSEPVSEILETDATTTVDAEEQVLNENVI